MSNKWKLMIVPFAFILAVASVVGSASADSDAAVYGSDVQPYAGIDVTYEELDDGATYYIVKGGSVSISFAGIEASGMETDLAGSGLITDYVDDRIYGTLEKSATVTIGEKTIRLEASEGTPIYGADLGTSDQGWMSNDMYIQVSGNSSISFPTKIGSYNMGTPKAPDLSAYGLTANVTSGGTVGSDATLTVTGTPSKGADNLEIKLTLSQGGLTGMTATYIVHLKIVDAFTINYDANGGSCSKSSDVVKYGSTVALPTATRTDHSFLGWYTQASGGTYRGTSNDTYDPMAHYTVDQTITFYAQWEEDTSPVTSVEISGSTSVTVGGSPITLTARTDPDDAKNHRVNWYIQSGSSYASITSTTDTTSGGTCTITGLAKGTAIIRAQAQDGSNVYKDCLLYTSPSPRDS